jgi:hypothetical protein
MISAAKQYPLMSPQFIKAEIKPLTLTKELGRLSISVRKAFTCSGDVRLRITLTVTVYLNDHFKLYRAANRASLAGQRCSAEKIRSFKILECFVALIGQFYPHGSFAFDRSGFARACG